MSLSVKIFSFFRSLEDNSKVPAIPLEVPVDLFGRMLASSHSSSLGAFVNTEERLLHIAVESYPEFAIFAY